MIQDEYEIFRLKTRTMTNKNYLIRPEASPKAAPVRKKDIQESLQEANETADKLLERMTEMNRKYSTLMASGITSRLDDRSVALFNTVLAETKAMPREVEKAVEKAIKTEMDKAMTRIDDKISEIKMLCIVITLFLNGLLAMAVLIMK